MSGLCHLASDWHGGIPAFGLMAEPKIDGWRCLFFPGTDGITRLWSRQGMPLEGADHILSRLARMQDAAGEALFIDGEIQVDGTLAATKHWFETGWRTGGDRGVFHAFDVLTYREWRAGGSDRPLYARKARLRALLDASEEADDGWTWREGSRGAEPPAAVRIVDDGWCFDAADVLAEARRVWVDGGEGLVLKDAEAPYRRKRSPAWLKVKPGGPWWRKLRAGATPIAA
jgi:ATP-dependent DNA ligase